MWSWRRSERPTSRASLPTEPREYPSGIAIRTEKGIYYLGKDNRRYRLTSQRIVDSWNFPLIVDASEAAVGNYPVAYSKLGFRDGTLLHNIKDGRMYLVSESRIRHITNPDVFTRLGVSIHDAMTVSDAEISIMKQGDEIN